MKEVIFLNHRRDVELLQYLQQLQEEGKWKAVVIRHKVLATYLKCSESSIRRSIYRLVEQGHIIRTYVDRPRGGKLCAYYVRPDVIYRHASFARRAKRKIEQVLKLKKRPSQGHSDATSPQRERITQSNDNKRSARPSLPPEEDSKLMDGLMKTAKVIGVDDQQRGFLRLAALRYGVREAWRALQIAYEHGYRIADLVRVAWGILKRQYPEGAMT